MEPESNMPVDETGENEGDADEAPEFIEAGDAVEVPVDDDVPMEDDEDEEPTNAEMGVEVTDMSRIKIVAHTDSVYAVALNIDPSTSRVSILSGGGDDKAYLHEIPADSPPVSNKLDHAHTDSVSCVAFNTQYVSEDLSKTPKYAAVGAYDGAIIVYDPDTGNKITSLEGPTDVEWLCFHPKGGTVLLAGSSADGTVWMYHIPMNKCLQVFVGHESAVSAGAFSPDGKWAVTCSADGTARIWAPKTGMSKHVFRLGDGAGLTCMGMNGGSDSNMVIVGGEDGQAHVCHIGTKKVVASLRHYEVPNNMQEEEELELPMSVEAVDFASSKVNSNWCATGGADGVLKIWDLTLNGQCRQTCSPQNQGVVGETGGITKLKWHPSLPVVFACYTNGSVMLWDARNGELIHTLTGNPDVINDLAIHYLDNGKTALVATAGDDKAVRLFDVDLVALLQPPSAN